MRLFNIWSILLGQINSLLSIQCLFIATITIRISTTFLALVKEARALFVAYKTTNNAVLWIRNESMVKSAFFLLYSFPWIWNHRYSLLLLLPVELLDPLLHWLILKWELLDFLLKLLDGSSQFSFFGQATASGAAMLTIRGVVVVLSVSYDLLALVILAFEPKSFYLVLDEPIDISSETPASTLLRTPSYCL